jgi:hypothetical protein
MNNLMKNLILVTLIHLIYNVSLIAKSPVNSRNPGSSYSKENKFMIGANGGLTFVQPLVLQKFNVIYPLDNTISQSGIKTYKPFFRNIGYQYAFTGLYKLNNSLDIRLEPNFTTSVYKYDTEYSWISTGGDAERIDMNLKHRQSLNYIEIPITIRYLYGSGTARPFIQTGLFYGFLLNANKSSEKTESFSNTSGSSTLSTEKQTGDARPLYVKSHYGFNAGIGVDYDLSYFHLTFDLNLNYGVNSVTNEAGRYSNQQYTSGLYDIQDNIRFIIPSVNIGILFPLKKPSKSKIVCLN